MYRFCYLIFTLNVIKTNICLLQKFVTARNSGAVRWDSVGLGSIRRLFFGEVRLRTFRVLQPTTDTFLSQSPLMATTSTGPSSGQGRWPIETRTRRCRRRRTFSTCRITWSSHACRWPATGHSWCAQDSGTNADHIFSIRPLGFFQWRQHQPSWDFPIRFSICSWLDLPGIFCYGRHTIGNYNGIDWTSLRTQVGIKIP